MSATKKNWNYDEVHSLIQAVRKNPSLYDRRDPDYNQTRTKEVRFHLLHFGNTKLVYIASLQCDFFLVNRISGRRFQRMRQSLRKVVSALFFHRIISLAKYTYQFYF